MALKYEDVKMKRMKIKYQIQLKKNTLGYSER